MSELRWGLVLNVASWALLLWLACTPRATWQGDGAWAGKPARASVVVAGKPAARLVGLDDGDSSRVAPLPRYDYGHIEGDTCARR